MSEDPSAASSQAPIVDEARASILMVEDNADVRLMGATLLEEAGFEVHQAADADEAMSMVLEGLGFDLLSVSYTHLTLPTTERV